MESCRATDASPSLLQAFRRNLSERAVACESVEDSLFFNRMFDGVLAWGLMFLLQPEEQRRLIHSIDHILVPAGRLLFTSPEPAVWNDTMTGLESRSLAGSSIEESLLQLA
jgi:hypothetical protein